MYNVYQVLVMDVPNLQLFLELDSIQYVYHMVCGRKMCGTKFRSGSILLLPLQRE